jgi:hypothetical protein
MEKDIYQRFRMNHVCIWLFFFFSVASHAQNTLTGIVLSKNNRQPVEYASVYVNGTSIGAYTNAEGKFTLNNVPIACRLIISHIGYNLQQTAISSTTAHSLKFYLDERISSLPDISVTGKNDRKKMIADFKLIFLGDDKWGKNAVLKNDSVIYFSRRVDTLVRKSNSSDFSTQRKYGKLSDDGQWSNDSAHISSKFQVLSAISRTPLLVDLPLLGYSVSIDLVYCDVLQKTYWRECSYWSYQHFNPYPQKPKSQQARYEKNRKAVYFNSSKHFCQSLFDNKLKENGYLLSVIDRDNFSPRKESRFIDLDDHIVRKDSSEINIVGLKDQEIRIDYFSKGDGTPIDLTKINYDPADHKTIWKNWDIRNESAIIFKSDSCTVRFNGTIPDTNIMFDGKMASKRGGALLPDDYKPSFLRQ